MPIVRIPYDYYERFDLDPFEACRNILSIPLGAVNPFFKSFDSVKRCIDYDMVNPFDDSVMMFDANFIAPDTNPRYMHIDLAIKRDSIGVSMAHVPKFVDILRSIDGVERYTKMPIIKYDFIGKITADKGDELLISDVRDLIINEISRRGYNIRLVSFDTFGCLSGDTKIKLLDGTAKTIKELSEKPSDEVFWVYSYDSATKRVVPGKAKNARITKRNIEVYKVYLDNGKFEICTGEHLFLMRDSTYKEAKDLKKNDSIMPLYTKFGKIGKIGQEYETVNHPDKDVGRKLEFTHRMVARNMGMYKHGRSSNYLIHHKDCNPLNNSPDNLIEMPSSEHVLLHQEYGNYLEKGRKVYMDRLKNDKEFLSSLSEKRRIIGKKRVKDNPEWFKKFVERGREGTIEFWKDPKKRKETIQKLKKYNSEHREDVVRNIKSYWDNLTEEEYKKRCEKMAKIHKEQWKNPEYIKKMSNRCPIYPKFESTEPCYQCNKYFLTQRKDKKLCSKECKRLFVKKYGSVKKYLELNLEKEPNNHKIVKIEKLNMLIDTYDLEVENYHNFALDSGVFVHNSLQLIQTLSNEGYAVDFLSLDRTTSLLIVDFSKPNRVRRESTKGSILAAWNCFRDAMIEGRIITPYLPALETEIKHAERRIKSGKVKIECQSKELSLDLLESMAGTCYNATNNEHEFSLSKDSIFGDEDIRASSFYKNMGRDIESNKFIIQDDNTNFYDSFGRGQSGGDDEWI